VPLPACCAAVAPAAVEYEWCGSLSLPFLHRWLFCPLIQLVVVVLEVAAVQAFSCSLVSSRLKSGQGVCLAVLPTVWSHRPICLQGVGCWCMGVSCDVDARGWSERSVTACADVCGCSQCGLVAAVWPVARSKA
jgi:hypothetical protein